VRYRDLLGLSLSALYQQKLRTLLTTLGVVFGSFVLVASLSVTQGVQATVVEAYSRFRDLRKITVFASLRERDTEKPQAQVSDRLNKERRQRLERELKQRQGIVFEPKVPLDRQRIGALASLPHVRSVAVDFRSLVWAGFGRKVEQVLAVSASPGEELVERRLVLGEPFSSPDSPCVLVSELLLYKLGAAADSELQDMVGKKLRVELRDNDMKPSFLLQFLTNRPRPEVSSEDEKLLDDVVKLLPEALSKLALPARDKARLQKLLAPPARPRTAPPEKKTVLAEELTICGVLRAVEGKEDQGIDFWRFQNADVILPPKTAEELSFRLPHQQKNGLNSVILEVDDLDNVKDVIQRVRNMGFEENSWLKLIEREQFMFLLVFAGMSLIAVVALTVAALGITNTMLMSVLERVREIGVMKAVGARNGHIQMIFLVEGALIGLTGGLVGLLASWAASFPGDAWVRSLVASRLSFEMKESVFVFDAWLVLGVPLFACLITTVAAVYPARRAARVDPVTALRHD
jgi:putative ABC transport system permease protein